jgi:hypothetical protein
MISLERQGITSHHKQLQYIELKHVDIVSQQIGIAMERDQQSGTDRIMNVHKTAIIMK